MHNANTKNRKINQTLPTFVDITFCTPYDSGPYSLMLLKFKGARLV